MEQANRWRADFPVLSETVHGKRLVYLDNAATSQVPTQVLERLKQHYETEHANIHRGIHYLSELSTGAVEDARKKVNDFLNGEASKCVIFTSGTTDSIHLVSASYRETLYPGQGIIVTELEHHSNYVPWQQACKLSGADFYVCPQKDGELDLDVMEQLLKEHEIALVAAAHVTNLTGTVNSIQEIVKLAHRYGAKVLIDGAQGILHEGIDVSEADCDYYCFSGHKMLAPTGIGVLYGKSEALEALQKIRYGGGMVDLVTQPLTTWASLPHCLEAGTPNISGIIGLGTAIDYIIEHDPLKMRAWERELLVYAEQELLKIEGLSVMGHPGRRSGALSMDIEGVHPFDLASMADKMGVALRSGNLCAQPALASLGYEKAIRLSPAFYNTKEEIDQCRKAFERIIPMLRKFAD